MPGDREVDMTIYELKDDEPLSPAEVERMDLQRMFMHSVLVSRAAAGGMTPAQMMTSGQVAVPMPDEPLAEPARPAPPRGGGFAQTGATQVPAPDMNRRSKPDTPVQAWLDTKGAAPFIEGFDSYFQRGATEALTSDPHDVSAPPIITVVNDSEVVEAELLVGPSQPISDDDDDIVDAEIVGE